MLIFSFAKALHVIGFVSWFAGLFYIVRMFVYDVEAEERPAQERDILKKQFQLMQKRVYKIIMTPAMVMTYIGGITMLIVNDAFLQMPWMHVKLAFVLLLTGYHHWCNRIRKNLLNGTNSMTASQLRQFNEIATLLLVAIAILAVYQNMTNFLYAFLVLVGVMVLLMIGIKAYKRARAKNPEA